MKEFTSQRWICVQEQDNGSLWYYEPSLSYTRKESIRLRMEDSSMTWRHVRDRYKWSCIKVQLTLTPTTQP